MQKSLHPPYVITQCPKQPLLPALSASIQTHHMLIQSLEKEMATHTSILAWEILWTEEPGRLQSIGHKELDTSEVTEHTRSHACIALGLWIWGWGLAVWWQ